MDIKKLAEECWTESIVDIYDFYPSELELFAQKIIAARDAEWMAEPVGVWHQGDTEEESDFFLGNQIDDDCEHCTKLFAQPKEVK